MSYVYLRSRAGDVYTVGHYQPDGTWIAESDHETPEKAAERVHYLNGGVSEAHVARILRALYTPSGP